LHHQESKIHALSKNDALKFIANLMNEEEAVGEVSTIVTSRTRQSSSLGNVRKALDGAVEKINGGSSENESVVEDTLEVEERPADVSTTRRKRVRGATE
jgi:hypothetical protein